MTRATWIGIAAAAGVAGAASAQTDPNSPGILEPSLTQTTGEEVRIPNTDQADGDQLLNLVGNVVEVNARVPRA